jgi:uncharacterized protein YdhG (YjbR/CyaY superfamily)
VKTSTSSARGSALQPASHPKNIDEYLAGIPEPARSTLNKIRGAIRSALPPDATETISYRIPAFKLKKMVIWFAAFADHCSLFPTASVVEALKDELKGLSISKGTIRFPVDRPLSAKLVRRLVKVRLAQLERKE